MSGLLCSFFKPELILIGFGKFIWAYLEKCMYDFSKIFNLLVANLKEKSQIID